MGAPRGNSSTATYAYAYPLTDARTRGRVKISAEAEPEAFHSKPSAGVEDVFNNNPQTSSATSFPLEEDKPVSLMGGGWFGTVISSTIYCTSLFLVRSVNATTTQTLSLSIIQSAVVLVVQAVLTLVGAEQVLPQLSSHEAEKDGNENSPAKRLFTPKSPKAHHSSTPKKTPSKTSIESRPKRTSRAFTGAVCMILEQISLLYVVNQLSISRVLILTTCSSKWSHSLSSLAYLAINKPLSLLGTTSLNQDLSDSASGGVVVVCMLMTCYAIDSLLNSVSQPDDLTLGYLSLLAYLFLRGFRISRTHQRPTEKIRAHKSTAVLAAAIGSLLGLAAFISLPRDLPHPHFAKLTRLIPLSLVYSIISYLYNELPSSAGSEALHQQDIGLMSYMVITIISCELVGRYGFAIPSGDFSDVLVSIICYLGLSNVIPYRHLTSTADKDQQLSLIDRLLVFGRKLKTVVKTILQNSESRNIYFFLCLNLGYMLVQMMYGIWTNSLGLISDSIHMFFDCMALGMGLFASVMATWPPDEEFTYGYGRVETLSGFANGIFLMLISVFIVFEAIQRLLNPPEMNTNKLLVVSFVGLMVNLVGMFATGHHHHHGHSHSHGHDHGHDHGHGHSHNMKGVFLHVMADTLGSVGVIISTLLIERYQWTGFDPIASIFIAVLIFASVVPLVLDSARVLILDLGPEKEIEVRKALGQLTTVEGLSSYSVPRFWPKDPATISGSIHLQLTPNTSTVASSGREFLEEATYSNVEKVKARVEQVLFEGIEGLDELVLQVEGVDGIKNCSCLTRNWSDTERIN